VRVLAEAEDLEGVRIIDGGTDPWAALARAEGCRALVALDAVAGGKEPGEFHRLLLEEIDSTGAALSLHGVTLFHLLRYERLLGNGFEHIRVLGMEPHVVDYGVGLSALCQRRLPAFVQMVRAEVADVRRRLCAGQGGG